MLYILLEGKSFIKKSQFSKFKIIRSKHETDNLLLEATANKPRMLRSKGDGAATAESDGDDC